MSTFDGENLICTLTGGSSVIEIVWQDVYSEWKDWMLGSGRLNRKYPQMFSPDGGAPLTSIIDQGRYYFLQNQLGWRIKPAESNTTYYAVGNLAVNDTTLPAFVPTDGTYTAAILGLQPITQGVTEVMGAQLAYSSFEGGVWVDINSGISGTGELTTGPIGNAQNPVNNIPDAIIICSNRGLPKTLYVIADLTLGLGDDVRGFKLIGLSHVRSQLTVGGDCLCFETNFEAFDITGTLDGDSEIVNCTVSNITYFNGHIHNSSIDGTITLSGTKDAKITNCSQLNITSVPIIDCGGSGQNLVMTNYTGRLKLQNLTGASEIGVGFDAGEMYIEASCTAGIVALSGTGKAYDNSAATCYVVDTLVDGSTLTNIQKLLELQRPHHTGTGKVIFWNPYGGDDTRAGDHTDRSVKTFAQAHTLADDNGHDIIICVPGDPSGNTVSVENIVITKNYLFVRGPGRDFRIHSTNDLLPTIDIQANGVEISSVIITNELTNTKSCIESNGKFPLIKDVYIEDSTNGIHITGGEHGIIECTRIGHNTGFGVSVDGASEHFIIRDNHLGTNGGGGVLIDLSTGHEVTISDCVIHGNTGYGINISAQTSGVQIKSDVNLFGNTLGSVNNLGTNTYDESNMASAVTFIKEIEGGRWKLDSTTNQIIFYEEDNTTEIARFNTFNGVTPAVTDVTERVRV